MPAFSPFRCSLLVIVAAFITPISSLGEEKRMITVLGEGKATAPPNVATVHTGVETQKETAQEALDLNNRRMKAIMDLLKEQGIAERDIQTSQFNIRPVYERNRNQQTPPRIIAYRVTNQLRVKVRDIDKLGVTLDGLVQVGSNQLSGIGFEVAEPSEVMNRARERAIADARTRAETYARAAGVRVGQVQSISEQTHQVPQPRFLGAAAQADRASVPVAPGEEEFRVQVEVTYTIEGKAAVDLTDGN